jgi:hypothetical protein
MLMVKSGSILGSDNYERFEVRLLNRFNKIAVMSQEETLPAVSILQGPALRTLTSRSAAIPL